MTTASWTNQPLQNAFDQWVAQQGAEAYALFRKFTVDIVEAKTNRFFRFLGRKPKAGLTKTSAWLIANRVRWESEVSEADRLQVPNDFIALMARKFMSEHPQYGQVFDTRAMKRA